MHLVLIGRWQRVHKLLNASRFPDSMNFMYSESFTKSLNDKFSTKNRRAKPSTLFKPAFGSLHRRKEAQGAQKMSSKRPQINTSGTFSRCFERNIIIVKFLLLFSRTRRLYEQPLHSYVFQLVCTVFNELDL